MITLDDLKVHCAQMMDSDLIAIDTETTGLEVKTRKDYCIGISLAYRLGPLGMFSLYIPLRHEEGNLPLHESLALIRPILNSKPLVFHNRKFDLHSLATLGLTEFNGPQYDTLIEAQLVDENLWSKELDYLSKRYLKDQKDKDRVKPWAKTFGWGTVPAELMEPYAIKDAELTGQLHTRLWKEVKEQSLDSLWGTEIEFQNLLYSMESEGVGVNRDFCQEYAERGRRNLESLESVIGFAPSSTKELGRFFFEELKMPVLELTPAGKPSLNKHVMEEYDELLDASNNPIAKLVLEYRGWQKAVTSLYEPMLRLEVNGKIHANVKQHGTITGRLSYSDPNLQQIPRKSEKVWNGKARQAFNAGDPEFDLIGYDYSQLELRLAAAYGNEGRLLEEFLKDDADPFTAYSPILGVPRQETKTFFYSNIYGAGVGKIAYTLGRDVEEVREIHKRFIESIPGIRRASQRANELAASRGYVRYWTGRRRHFPYGEDAHKAFNSILQGGAAELVKYAMLRMRDLEGPDLKMLLQVHDEIVFKVRKGTLDKYDAQIRERMTNFPQFGVRFTVEPKVWNG